MPQATCIMRIHCFFVAIMLSTAVYSEDFLPGWNASTVRSDTLRFITRASDPDSEAFIPEESRIAVFDVDGTLWVEKPLYPLVDFLQSMGSRANDLAGSDHSLINFAASLSEGIDRKDYQELAQDFLLVKSRHPKFGKPYGKLLYKPTLELIQLLRAHDFQIFLCSGSDASFLRSVTEELFGVPSANVIGQAINYELLSDGGRITMRRAGNYREPLTIGAGKVSNIVSHIGKRPVLAVGNSLGDAEMLTWVSSNGGFSMIILHDDGLREYDYGNKNQAIKEKLQGSNVRFVSMKEDFRLIL